MPSATGALKIMFLTAVRPISSLGSAVKSTCLLAAHPGHRPITYSVLQRTFRLVSTTSKVRSVATKKKKKPGDEEDDFESAAWENYDSVQEIAKVDLYNMPPSYKLPQDGKKAQSSKFNHHKIQQFLKHYESTADHLAKHDRKVLRMLEAIKEPMMEQIKPRSALIDSSTCKKVCHLFGDLKNPETVIALGNPGTGLISQELVRQGAKNLFLFETNGGIRKHLVDVHENDKGVRIVEQHLFTNNWVHTETDCKLVRILESDEFKNVKVIHSLTNPMQFPILVTLYTANHMPYHLKDTELFFFSKPDYAAKLVDSCSTSTSQRKFSIWRKFVKTESLITLDANAFFPPFVTEGLGRGPYKHGHVTLVRCTFPAIEYNGKPLTVEKRHLYFTFLRHCMATSSAPVVQTLEKWSPGIGAKLICQGFPLFIPFTGLTDEQFLGVFMTFLQHVPAESPIWSLIAGPKYHVKFAETPSPST